MPKAPQAAGMPVARYPGQAFKVEGISTPPHAFDEAGHHFSNQDYQFRKQLCLTRQDHQRGENGKSQQSPKPKVASDDKAREEHVKWQHYNHRRTSIPTMTCLLQPGHQDDGDSYWGVIREDRKSDVPHWSQRQFDIKKGHHTARIHKTEKGRSEVNNVSTNAAHFLHPEESKKSKIFGESGLADGHNSYAHFAVSRRRHQQPVDNNEANHRSQEPPLPSHSSHFFKSPEPYITCSYLLPEGPSVTAKHIPKHFVQNVIFDDPEFDPYSSRICGIRHSVDRKYDNRILRADGVVAEPRIADFKVFDGTSTRAVSELTKGKPPEHLIKPVRCSIPPPPTTTIKGRSWDHTTENARRKSHTSEDFQHLTGVGKPPDPSKLPQHEGHTVFRSQAQLQYEKHLCHTDMRHTDRWERMEQGSVGHSAGGSEFSSIAHGAGEPHARRETGDLYLTRHTERRSRSSEPTQKTRTPPKTARAASSERLGRSRTARAASSERLGRSRTTQSNQRPQSSRKRGA